MAETFYSVLGVETDADVEAIRHAYREQVKRHHPDVSDDPDAPERFKRLTTARDVLVDDGERSRYDSLGHDDYVRNHVESSVWATGSTSAGRSGSVGGHTRRSPSSGGESREQSKTARSTRRGSTSDGGGHDRTAWMGESGPSDAQRNRHRKRKRGRARAAGATASAEDWQHASKAYRRADTDVETGEKSLLWSVFSGLVSVGPWLFVHLVFIGSAIATAYLAIVQADTYIAVSWPTLLGGVVLLGLVVFASVLHVVSQLYS